MKKHIPKILIVDDDQLYLKQFSAILSKEIQAKYYFSYSAKDAIELINKNSYAIILLDVNIPEKNGFELAKDVRNSKLNIHTPIIFITGISVDDHSVFEGYKAGGVDYLSKPVNQFILISKIKTFLKLDFQKNELVNAQYNLEKSYLDLQKKDSELKELNRNLEKQVEQRTQQLVKEIDENVKAKANLQIQANQLRENNLFLENLIDTIPNPVYYKNEKGEYLGCNKAFEEFQSAKKEDIIGKTIYNIAPKEFADKINKLDTEIIKSGKKRITEIKFPNFDGSIRNLILHKNKYKIAHSNKSGIISTVIDITEIKRTGKLIKIQNTIDYLASLKKGIIFTLKNILNHIIELEWIDSGAIYLYDKEKEELELVTSSGISANFTQSVLKYNKNSPQMKIVLEKKPVYGNYQKISKKNRIQIREKGLQLIAVIPLINSETDELVGCINLGSRKYDRITVQEKSDVEFITHRLVSLIVYAQTQDELKMYQKELELKVGQRTKELNDANLKLIKEIEFHKRTKIALVDSENKYRSIFENAQDGIVLYDAETLELVEVNKKAYRDLGYTYAEFKNFKYGDFVIYKDRSERGELIKQLLSKGKISFQTKHKKKNGEIRYRIINASLLDLNDKKYIQGIIHDITELKEKEIELQKSEQRYRDIQSNIPFGMWMTDPAGKFLYANKAVINMLGYDSGEEMLKVSALDLYYDKNKRSEVIKILKQKDHINNEEVQFVRKDKSVFWASMNVKAIFDKDGNLIRLDGITENISEKKKIQLKLLEAHEEIKLINRNLEKKIKNALKEQRHQQQYMVQKSKLESLGELAAGIAHEINQPLGIMSLSFENLQMKILSKTTTPNYLHNKFNSIEDNIKRIRQIIDHIRAFSRDQDSLVMEKINLNKVVNKALSLIGTQYSNHNINIKLDLKNNIGFTIGSNMQIEQVILNLLANAKYAIEDKATYSNETDYTKEIIIRSDSSDKNVILMIEDNGTGIDAHILSKIFDPFFTTKPEGFGTGLGLSIAYGIIKNMHGEIQVRSSKEEYTKINIFFPRFPEKD